MVWGLLKGLWTTFKSMFEAPVTYQYPEIKRPVRERFKGRHFLHRYENGLEKCIGCSLCAAACPAASTFGWVASPSLTFTQLTEVPLAPSFEQRSRNTSPRSRTPRRSAPGPWRLVTWCRSP